MNSEYDWPDWVPAELRSRIEVNWQARGGREAWEAERLRFGAPQTGEVKTARLRLSGDDWATGRYVYIVDNLGAIVEDNGSVWYALNQDEVGREGG